MKSFASKTKRFISLLLVTSIIMGILPLSTIAMVNSDDVVKFTAVIDEVDLKETYQPGDEFYVGINVSYEGTIELGTIVGALEFDIDKLEVTETYPGSINVNPDGPRPKLISPKNFDVGLTNPKTGETHENQLVFWMESSDRSIPSCEIGGVVFKVKEGATGTGEFTFVNPEASTYYANSEESENATLYTSNSTSLEVKLGEDTPAVHEHTWGTPTYVWADDNSTVTATVVCSGDASHTSGETVNTTSSVTKEATETESGETTYTATFTNSLFTTQTKVVADIAPLPHTHAWGTPDYVWADDNSTVTATVACTKDASHTSGETVNTSSSVTKEATETES